MDYQSQMNEFSRFGMNAIERLLGEEYSELMLSADEKQVAEAIVGQTRLNAEELLTPQSEQEMYGILEGILAYLVYNDKIAFKPYGLSTLAIEQKNHLIFLIEPTVQATPADEYADIVSDYNNLPSDELNRKRRNPEWLARFNAAVTAGVI